MKALILIDLQNDFMPNGALAVPNGHDCIKAANAMQSFFKVIIATQDWHPPEHLSFAANNPKKKPGDTIELLGLKQTLWPTHCVQNTPGASLVKELDQTRIRHVVTKGEEKTIDSYSAFFDNARHHQTGLHDYLVQQAIDEIYLLGVATEYCVKFSALDALTLGIKTNVIIDGCRGIGLSQRDIPDAITEMKDKGVRLVNMIDVANGLM